MLDNSYADIIDKTDAANSVTAVGDSSRKADELDRMSESRAG